LVVCMASNPKFDFFKKHRNLEEEFREFCDADPEYRLLSEKWSKLCDMSSYTCQALRILHVHSPYSDLEFECNVSEEDRDFVSELREHHKLCSQGSSIAFSKCTDMRKGRLARAFLDANKSCLGLDDDSSELRMDLQRAYLDANKSRLKSSDDEN